MENLKIGLDFHGVIDNNPKFFSDFSKLAIDKGYEIHIISGGPYIKEKDYLEAWEINYTSIFAMVDYFDSLGQITYFENDKFRVPDELWDRAKALYCQENLIDIQIDDTVRYKQYFTTPFAIYDKVTQSCKLNNQTIDLSISPATSLQDIENYLFNL